MTVLGNVDRWVWQDLAACDNQLALFFGPETETNTERDQRESAAARVCGGCPVIADCLEHALHHPERYGVWGGTTPSDRVTIKSRLAKAQRRAQTRDLIPAEPGQMPAVGDMRILQGLAAYGYDVEEVRSWTRLPARVLYQVRSGRRRSWAQSSSVKLRAAIPDILHVPALHAGPEKAFAMAQGWLRLDAWEWDTIDNPHARPLRGGDRAGGTHAARQR